MTFRRALVAAVIAGLALGGGSAAPAGAAVSLVQVGSFTAPVFATSPPGDATRLFVVEQAGRVQLVHDGTRSTFLDIADHVRSGGEQGLLSMAFPPDYATSGLFYVYYTAPPPGGSGPGSDVTVSEFRRSDADHADRASERVVLRIPHRQAGNHNGGQLEFGPDGMLYLGTGDGGKSNDSLGNAQKTSPAWNDAPAGRDARLGKLLRIDPHAGGGCDGGCTIPAGNPGFAQPEIWAYGLRNPWRFSFDRATGDLTIGDVGQATWEEVDFGLAPGRAAGANFGWSTYEGRHVLGSTGPALSPPGVVMPVLEKAHTAPDSFSSLAGGYVVRDPALPELAGRYLYADTYLGDIRAVTLAPGGAIADAITGLHVSMLSSFGEDACGRVYAVSLDGPVYRLAQSGPAQGGECGLPPAAGPPAPASSDVAPETVDRTAPVVRLVAAARQRPWRTGVVALQASCDETCDLTARGTFLLGRRRTLATAAKVTLRTATVTSRLAAATIVTVQAKVSGRTRRSLLRALRRHRGVTVRFTVAATDPAGNATRGTARSQISLH